MNDAVGGWGSNGNGNSDGNGRKRWDAHIDTRLLDMSAGQHNMEPTFPGYEGLPFRGKAPDLKRGDPETKQPKKGADVRVDVLDLSKPEDAERMRQIWQLVANGYAVVSKEDIQYDTTTKNWRVFVRWAELYMYDPKRGHQHGHAGE